MNENYYAILAILTGISLAILAIKVILPSIYAYIYKAIRYWIHD